MHKVDEFGLKSAEAGEIIECGLDINVVCKIRLPCSISDMDSEAARDVFVNCLIDKINSGGVEAIKIYNDRERKSNLILRTF